MIGALIGDLAAWTYEHDRDLFWKQLIPKQGFGAEPSVYGHALIKAASHNLMSCPWIDTSPVGTMLDGVLYYGQWLMWQIVDAWMDKIPNVYPQFEQTGKEEFYARVFTKELIQSLRNGMSKSQAYHKNDMFVDLSHSWKWKIAKGDDGLLSYVFRAWNAFYLGHDYTSTIHNAVKWSGARHLTCIIAGAFADAMYGCRQNMIKRKFSEHDSIHEFGILITGEEYGYHHALMHEMANVSISKRVFWPKNNSRTDVERHHWTPVHSEFESKVISKVLRKHIIMSFEPGWDDRYSFYLDDGWIYLCRSFVLICRFKFHKKGNGTFRLCNIERCDTMDDHEIQNALENALYSAEHNWDFVWHVDEEKEIDDCIATK